MSTHSPANDLPDGVRRVVIDPLTRVEGHGRVTLFVDAQGHVLEARLNVVEFRGFERFILGRPYWEVPVTVQRLCGICPVSHQLAASKALDAALGVTALTPTALAVRRLMHYGQILQSHALHFFHLSSPDLLYGFDHERTRQGIVAVAQSHPDIARRGVMLRKFGQEVICATTGRRIHGLGAVAGGVTRHVSFADAARLRAQADEIVRWCDEAVLLARRIHLASDGFFDRFAVVPSRTMSLVDADGALDFYDGGLRVRDAEGRIERDGVPGSDYLDFLEEEVRPWSYMKFPYLRSLGPGQGWYRVGPLARLHNCERIGTPHAQAAREDFISRHDRRITHAPLASHWARMIEMLHAAEVVRNLLADDRICSGERMRDLSRGGEGVGVIEAPRGTLIHHYRVGDDDLVTDCNLIVSTTHNNQAMNLAIREAAAVGVGEDALDDALAARIEVAIRAFDPCLSCATHAIGRMPLVIDVADTAGRLLKSIVRGGALA